MPRDLQPIWSLDVAINVVLFAGMGGACQGLEEAGFPIHVAVNHDKVAIATHEALNPHTHHIQADIYEVDPLEATGGRSVNILWASPDCRDHSAAKGGAPRSPRVRSMPWQVCRWIGVLRRHGRNINNVFLENVCEIRGWGPLIAKRDKETGRVLRQLPSGEIAVAAPGERVPVRQQLLVRDPRHVGRIWRAWCRQMDRLGVRFEARDLRCADFGVPTTRKRLFGVGVFDDLPILWPEVTHAPRSSAEVKARKLKAYRPIAEHIDWSLPLPSIFERKKPIVAATRRRVAVGMKKFVLDAAEPFLVSLTHTGGDRVRGTGDPMPTNTTAHRGEFSVVLPSLACTDEALQGDGVAAFLEEHRSRSIDRMSDAPTPMPSQSTKEHHAVVEAYLTRYEARGVDLEDSLPTSTTENRFGVVGAWIIQHNTDAVGNDIADPASTLVVRGTQKYVGGAYLAELRGTATAKSVADPMPGQTAGGFDTAPVAAFMMEHYSTGGQYQGVDKPLNTLSTKDRFVVAGSALGMPPLSSGQYARARQVAEFLREHGVWSGGDLVTLKIKGRGYIIVDIGMRMLTPGEAAAAHELRLPKSITIDGVTRPLTKTEAMHLVGNSVPKRMARLLSTLNDRSPLAPLVARKVA